jgi:hypothetical protein
MRFHPAFLTLAIVTTCAAGGGRASAQGAPLPPPQAPPPAPAAPVETRPDFSGTWTLDRALSNEPEKANFDAAQSSSSQGTQRRGGFGGGGGGFGGGGFGRGGGSYGGGSRNRGASSDGATADEKTRLAALTDELKKSFTTLVISHHEPSFVVTDAQEHAAFCHTTGEKEDQLQGGVTIPSLTKWDGAHLVTEYDLSSRRRLMFTYALLPATRQLVLRVRLDADSGPRGGGSELKLVYKMSAANAAKP